jgi:hypothetical protein
MQDYAGPVQGFGQRGDTVLQELLCQGMSSPSPLEILIADHQEHGPGGIMGSR